MNLQTLTLPSPAKLNLGLHICGRRSDGYHNLQTAFQFIDICDELTFALRDDAVIRVTPDLPGVAEKDNLVWRAATLLQQHGNVRLGNTRLGNTRLGANITLQKRLPMGGGIGGGSSNAATTLMALNQLWQCGLDREALKQLGTTLGADVPIFIHGHAAFAQGIGEILTDVDLNEPWYLVLVPQVHVSTAQIFSHRELTRHSEIMRMSAFFEQGSRNDCEALVRKLYPAVDDAMRWLSHYGQARLTGTGACVYRPCESHQQAQEIATQVPENWQYFIARGCNESPLQRALAQHWATAP